MFSVALKIIYYRSQKVEKICEGSETQQSQGGEGEESRVDNEEAAREVGKQESEWIRMSNQYENT